MSYRISILAILICFIWSCKSSRFNGAQNLVKEEIIDSTLISTMKTVDEQFVYANYNSILFKANRKDYDSEIEETIAGLEEGSYKEAHQELQSIMTHQFEKTNSVDLKIIKSSILGFYPIPALAKSGKLYVYDKKSKQVQDAVWEKHYYREKFNKDLIRERFESGKLYTTKDGIEFLRVALESGN